VKSRGNGTQDICLNFTCKFSLKNWPINGIVFTCKILIEIISGYDMNVTYSLVDIIISKSVLTISKVFLYNPELSKQS
jgi:hypothetical protein